MVCKYEYGAPVNYVCGQQRQGKIRNDISSVSSVYWGVQQGNRFIWYL